MLITVDTEFIMLSKFIDRCLRPLVYHRFFTYFLLASAALPQALFGYIYMAEFRDHAHIQRHSEAQEVKVFILDIGQGDSIFIQTPGGSLLIDSGPSGGSLLRQIGKEMPFYKDDVDVLLATHEDADHIAGFPAFLKKYFTSMFLSATKLTKTSIAVALQKEIDQRHIRSIPALRGMRVTFQWNDESAYLDILYPRKINDTEEDTNDMSIVARFVYASTSIMLTGDSPIASELAIIKTTRSAYLRSDILKVGHHGSKNSSSDEFLHAVSPTYAVISDGAGNRYGHPNQEVLDRLAYDTDAQIIRTDQQGTITFTTDGTTWQIKTEK